MTRDMTRGNPARLILSFTIPLLLGNIFQQFYSMADTVIVGRTIGVDALAAVGSTGSLSFLIIGFAQGLTAGFAVVTAQRFGADDEDGVRRSVTTSVVLSLIITVVLTTISTCFARPILELMQTPADIIDNAERYVTVIFSGIGASVLFNLLSNIIRALGDSRTPLLFLIIACVCNIALDFLFILTFHMGVAGAAWATILSQALSGLMCLYYIHRRLPILTLHKRDWKMERGFTWQHVRVGLPMGFQFSIIAIGSMILQSTLNTLGSEAVASFTAAQRIDQLATQPLNSFGVTMATYAAQNYGAGDIKRIRTGVRQCTLISVGVSLLGAVFMFLCGGSVVRLFVGADQPQVVDNACIYLYLNCSMYFLLALLFVYRNTLQGLGKSFIPTFAGFMELGMRTAAAVFMAQYFGFTGVCTANPLAWIGAVVPLGITYFLTIRKLERESEQAQMQAAAESPALEQTTLEQPEPVYETE